MDLGNILVVDDEEDIRNFLATILNRAGYRVGRAADPHQALDLLHKMPYELLITDLAMPGMNGLDLLDLLRQRNIKWPAILITSHPTAAIRDRVAAAGVRLIEKPLLNDTLFQSIHSSFS